MTEEEKNILELKNHKNREKAPSMVFADYENIRDPKEPPHHVPKAGLPLYDILKSTIQAVEVKLSLKIEEINHRLHQAEKENEELKSKVEILERNQRKNNIIIFGFEREERFISVESIIDLIQKLLNVRLVESDLNNIYSLGQTNNSPIKIEFTSYLKKITVLKGTKNLKGTSISIAHDLTELQRTENKILRKHLYAAKQDKNNTCFMKNNKLHLNDRIFTPSDLESLEEKIEVNFQSQSHSDPGTPTIELTLQNTIKEPTEPSQVDNKKITDSRGNLGIQVTPKTGAIKKPARDIPRDKPITRKNSNK
ncbi:unnamed protein product [Phaedon cochleariae]|uniref:Endonuclease-reverse transcriptase n=1 Tax=Phaedon cochleariae TaxID=80249 RepID=A0A9N9SHG4_PHACE|nr:unnamed protein product [Phaedon cochleariae]